MKHARLYRSGLVQRYHQVPEFSMFRQNNAAHQWGVTMLVLMFHPAPSLELIKHALTHDVGELDVGDLNGIFKSENPKFFASHRKLEKEYQTETLGYDFYHDKLTDEEKRWLRMCDVFEAWLHAAEHRPDVVKKRGWPEQLDKVFDMATELGCFIEVRAMALGIIDD